MCIVGVDEESLFFVGWSSCGRGASTARRTALVLLCDVVDTAVVGITRLKRRYGVMGVASGDPGRLHAQRDAAGVSAERNPESLDEPQLVTLVHDSALVDNDEEGVVGPGVASNCDLLVSEHAGHVRHAEETHTQDK